MADADLPAVAEDSSIEPLGPTIPEGRTPIHNHPAAGEIWRLCCRLRLEMREEGLGIKDAHLALRMAYPDLEISQKDLSKFMTGFVDDTIILEPGFFRRGLMKAHNVKLNAVVQAAKIAEKMDKAFEKAKVPSDPVDLQRYMLAGQRAMTAREKQLELMGKVGMGPQTDEQRASTAKPVAAPPVHIENATFNLSDAVGGSFAKRAQAAASRRPVDVEARPARADDGPSKPGGPAPGA